MCVYYNVGVCLCVCVCVFVYMCVFLYMRACMRVCVCACACTWCLCVCVCVCVCVCACACMHAHSWCVYMCARHVIINVFTEHVKKQINAYFRWIVLLWYKQGTIHRRNTGTSTNETSCCFNAAENTSWE